MKRKDFINCISKAIENSFQREDKSFFLCLSINEESISGFFGSVFSPEENDDTFTFGYEDGHCEKLLCDREIETRRVFAIQTFEQMCLDQKIYLSF